MNAKKILAMILALCLMLMATACGSTTPQSQIKGDLNNNG